MFNELARKRRSIKVYAAKPVEPEKIEAIVETALRSPSGRAARPWEFVVVTERALLEKLSTAKPMGGAFLKDAQAAVVVCADASAAPLWIEDCSIAAVTMQYAAESLGLGSRWMQIRGNQYSEAKTSTEYIDELLGIPANLTVLCIVAMGYPGEEVPPYRKEELLFNKVSYNRFGQRKA